MDNKESSKERNARRRAVGDIRATRVPVHILSPKGILRDMKRFLVDKVMRYCQEISNSAIIQTVCRRHVGVGDRKGKRDPNKALSYQTLAYQDMKDNRKFVSAASLATMMRNSARMGVKGHGDVMAGRGSVPSLRGWFQLLRKVDGLDIIQSGSNYHILSGGLSFRKLGFNTNEDFIALFQNEINSYQKRIDDIKRIDREKTERARESAETEEIQLSRAALASIDRLENKIAKWISVKSEMENGRDLISDLGSGITLESHLSKKDSGHRSVASILDRIVADPSILRDCRLIKDKDGDFYVIVSYLMPKETVLLDPSRVMGIDLGVNNPVVCAFSFSKDRARIGDRDIIDYQRNKFRATRRREQKRSSFSRKGKWVMSKKEKNWYNSYCHKLVALVIQFALKHGCGTIHVENLSGLRDKMDAKYKLLFAPSQFIMYLESACARYGIKVVKGNPRNSSLRCHKCGHTDVRNRNRCPKCGGERDSKKPICVDCGTRIYAGDFRCVKCGEKCDADYNAAKNIADWKEKEIKDGYDLSETSKPITESDNLPFLEEGPCAEKVSCVV